MKEGCYSFNKVCLPSSGFTPCEETAATQDCGGSNQWFWVLAAVTGIALMVNHGSKS